MNPIDKISAFWKLPRDQRLEVSGRAVATVAEANQHNLPIDQETLTLAKIGQRLKAEREEHERIRALIIRDAEDRDRNERRIRARREFEKGRFVNLDDTKDTLPPEQLSADEFEEVTMRPSAETAREISTVRRVSRIKALWRRGVLEDHEMAACSWYRDQWERAGGSPIIASTFDPKFGGDNPVFGHWPRTPAQLEAAQEYWLVHNQIPADLRAIVEAVVLHEETLETAGKTARLGFRNASAAFRLGVKHLCAAADPMMPTTRQKWD